MNGYIKLYRKLTQWGWYQDSVVKDLFLHLLLTASFKDFEWQGQTMKAGQLITGRKKLAEDLNFTEQQIRTALKKLESTKEISIFSTNKYSVITVINWEEYQICDDEATNEQPTNNQQITNKQPHIKNVKNNKNIYPPIIPLKKGGRKRKGVSLECGSTTDLDLFERMLNEEN